MKKVNVLINGKKEVLTLVYSKTGSFQYNTSGNKAAHSFNQRIDSFMKGTKIKTNGCEYEIL